MNICTEFEGPMLILCEVIIWTKFGLYVIKLKATVTLNFDGLISKSIGIIYTPGTNVCAKFDELKSILCLVNMHNYVTQAIAFQLMYNTGNKAKQPVYWIVPNYQHLLTNWFKWQNISFYPLPHKATF